MNYADYSFYLNDYKGQLTASLFNSYIPKASFLIDDVVSVEIDLEVLTDKEKYRLEMVACELVDYLNQAKSTFDNVLTSLSVDGVSKSFKQYTDKEHKNNISNILDRLPHTLIKYS